MCVGSEEGGGLKHTDEGISQMITICQQNPLINQPRVALIKIVGNTVRLRCARSESVANNRKHAGGQKNHIPRYYGHQHTYTESQQPAPKGKQRRCVISVPHMLVFLAGNAHVTFRGIPLYAPTNTHVSSISLS